MAARAKILQLECQFQTTDKFCIAKGTRYALYEHLVIYAVQIIQIKDRVLHTRHSKENKQSVRYKMEQYTVHAKMNPAALNSLCTLRGPPCSHSDSAEAVGRLVGWGTGDATVLVCSLAIAA